MLVLGQHATDWQGPSVLPALWLQTKQPDTHVNTLHITLVGAAIEALPCNESLMYSGASIGGLCAGMC